MSAAHAVRFATHTERCCNGNWKQLCQNRFHNRLNSIDTGTHLLLACTVTASLRGSSNVLVYGSPSTNVRTLDWHLLRTQLRPLIRKALTTSGIQGWFEQTRSSSSGLKLHFPFVDVSDLTSSGSAGADSVCSLIRSILLPCYLSVAQLSRAHGDPARRRCTQSITMASRTAAEFEDPWELGHPGSSYSYFSLTVHFNCCGPKNNIACLEKHDSQQSSFVIGVSSIDCQIKRRETTVVVSRYSHWVRQFFKNTKY